MKIREVVEAILSYHPNMGERENETVDTFKCGDAEAECTGVVTTILPTVEVIRKTAELGYNLIITHEPSFYSHQDPIQPVEGYQVFKDKIALLNKHGIAIWRDHDHLHTHKPDGIGYGRMKELGWEPYLISDENKPNRFKFPPKTVRELALEVKTKLGLNMLRVIGNLDATVETIGFCGHVFPDTPSGRHIDIFEKEGVDVIVPGEIIDWTVVSYTVDAAQLGYGRAIFNTGHMNGENLGMKYAAKWLTELLGGAVPVTFIDAGDIYQYI